MRQLAYVFIFTLISVAAGAQVCQDAFPDRADRTDRIDDRESSSSELVDATVLKVRLNAVIAHQNSIRSAKKLPLIKLAESKDEYVEPFSSISAEKDSELKVTTSSFPEEPIMAALKWDNSMIIRNLYNDLFSLNFVYKFRGARLISTEPYTLWLISKLPAKFTLYRKMSQAELQLWQDRKIESLGRSWGHTDSHNRDLKVIHFSTSAEFTSAAAGKSDPLLAVEFSRDELQTWYKSKNLLWTGKLSSEGNVDELVLPAELLKEISDHRGLRFHTVTDPKSAL